MDPFSFKSFNQYLIEDKNSHLQHIEDSILVNGSEGARQSINFLISLRNMLAGYSDHRVSIGTKFDGAPSLVCGLNPENGKFFVATKGAFAQTPKLMYSNKDIDSMYSGGLADKLKAALQYLPSLQYNGIYQGDFLFTPEDLSYKTIDNIDYLTFQPNTICYAVPSNSTMADEIRSVKFGFVVHTRYTGDTIETIHASFGIKASEFRHSPNVWLKDAEYKDVTGRANFDRADTEKINEILSEIGHTFARINGQVLNHIKSDENFKILLMTFNNSKIRAGQKVVNTYRHAQEFITFVEQKYKKEIAGLKLPDAKQKRRIASSHITNYVQSNLQSFKAIYELQNLVVDAKTIILEKLNQIQGLHTFTQTQSGYKVTNPEGFVVTDHLTSNTVKLVDRLEFSFNNFNSIKSWK